MTVDPVTEAVRRRRQAVDALAKANTTRLARVDLKRRIKAGAPLRLVILDPAPEFRAMKVTDLLNAQRRWGNLRSRRVLGSVGLSETTTLGALTMRQRLGLTAALRCDDDD
jgi:hypothetical protein